LKSAGFSIPGYEVRIDNPNEHGIGEIVMRGRANMLGYYKNENATKEVMDTRGFFHSGDLGKIDSEGFLFITGRIKELIITAGGENVAPIIIEDNFKLFCPIASNIMVVGEN
jgi:long-chain-fatty-acid--CoA ligase ACSBG